MTKKFEIIPIEDYGVMVDKEANFQEGDTAYSIDIDFYRVTKEDILHANENHWKVIATINKRIDDIPLIEIEDNLDELANKLWAERDPNKVFKEWDEIFFKNGVEKGYKAAGGYSEEDIERALECAEKACNLPVEASKLFPADVLISRNYFRIGLNKSLQSKLPKSVVLETFIYTSEPYAKYSKLLDKQQREAIREERVKITNPSTNTIIPISYE